MKLTILIFVLTTIIYKCQCAPNPDWIEDLNRDMKKMTEELQKNQQQMDKTFKNLGEQMKNSNKHFEEQMKGVGQFVNNSTNGLQDFKGINTNIVSGQSTISTSHIVNGHRVDTTVMKTVINNIEYRTIIEYNSETDKTTIKKYECYLYSDFECDLKSHEVKDGPPGSFN